MFKLREDINTNNLVVAIDFDQSNLGGVFDSTNSLSEALLRTIATASGHSRAS